MVFRRGTLVNSVNQWHGFVLAIQRRRWCQSLYTETRFLAQGASVVEGMRVIGSRQLDKLRKNIREFAKQMVDANVSRNSTEVAKRLAQFELNGDAIVNAFSVPAKLARLTETKLTVPVAAVVIGDNPALGAGGAGSAGGSSSIRLMSSATAASSCGSFPLASSPGWSVTGMSGSTPWPSANHCPSFR